MRYYESFFNINNDKELLDDIIYAFNKYDGQNFAVRYNTRKKEFVNFASRTQLVDETSEQFGEAVKLFKSTIEEELKLLIRKNTGKHKLFDGIEEITFYFEYVGENSFCGMHNPNDELKLILIDIWVNYSHLICCANLKWELLASMRTAYIPWNLRLTLSPQAYRFG